MTIEKFVDRVLSGKWKVCGSYADGFEFTIDNATINKEVYESQITIKDSMRGASSCILIDVSEIVFISGDSEFNIKVGDMELSFDESIF